MIVYYAICNIADIVHCAVWSSHESRSVRDRCSDRRLCWRTFHFGVEFRSDPGPLTARSSSSPQIII